MIKIDKGIPAPALRHNRWNPKYPWHEMEVGDSFLETEASAQTLYSMASRIGKENGKRFSIRSTVEGRRVWRVA